MSKPDPKTYEEHAVPGSKLAASDAWEDMEHLWRLAKICQDFLDIDDYTGAAYTLRRMFPHMKRATEIVRELAPEMLPEPKAKKSSSK